MCGINGIIIKSDVDEQIVRNKLTIMNNLIKHRGPDDDGLYVKKKPQYAIGLAMRRLSIIDLSSGNQPMFSQDKSIAIVFNGEIYNFKQLKVQLATKNVTFQTDSDTEVILKLYETYGTESFKMLDGMFAFSIYDESLQKVYIVRDFFGEKPLYYTHNQGYFIWASELKSIITTLNSKPPICKEGLNLFFRLTYIPAPYSIYENVLKLEANHYLTYDLRSFTLDKRKIHPNINQKKLHITFDDAKKQLKQAIFKSVESRAVADVPLGTFLSGGVDSSVVSYCLATMSDTKITTFSIGFEKASYDETDKSRIVAKRIGSNHHEFIINENDLKHHINDILLNFDEPFADSSSLPTYLVSSKAKNHVKVALTGDGGDEVFGGYNKYYTGKINSKYTNTVPEIIHNQIHKLSTRFLNRKDDNRGYKYKLNKLINAINYSDAYYWDIISLGFDNRDLNQYINSTYLYPSIFHYYKETTGISNPKTLNDFRTIDRHLSLEGDMLVKVDRTSMLNSLESRAPFLNKDLYDFTSQLPEDFLIHKWSKKHILKEAFKNEFPMGFLDKPKQGFGVPVGDWLREGLKEELIHYSNMEILVKQQIFNHHAIIELVENHLKGKKDNTFKVWAFFCFQKWYFHTYINN